MCALLFFFQWSKHLVNSCIFELDQLVMLVVIEKLLFFDHLHKPLSSFSFQTFTYKCFNTKNSWGFLKMMINTIFLSQRCRHFRRVFWWWGNLWDSRGCCFQLYSESQKIFWNKKCLGFSMISVFDESMGHQLVARAMPSRAVCIHKLFF